MNDFQREVLLDIKRGIDRARHEGVLVEYPRGAFINSKWVPWPLDLAAGEPLLDCACGPYACMGPNRALIAGLRCVGKSPGSPSS